VILITHVESVRDMLDHVISVRYDEESGSSVVSAGDDRIGLTGDGLAGAESLTGIRVAG
jgi:hypothetical protein